MVVTLIGMAVCLNDFTLEALDTMLALAPGATKPQLEAAMQGRILAQTQLMGTYRRRGR